MEAYQLYRKARIALELERFDEAHRLLIESLAIDKHFKTHRLLAETLTRLGDIAEAFLHSERAYGLSPVNDEVAIDFAERLVAQGEHARALVIVRETLARNDRYGPAQVLLLSIREE